MFALALRQIEGSLIVMNDMFEIFQYTLLHLKNIVDGMNLVRNIKQAYMPYNKPPYYCGGFLVSVLFFVIVLNQLYQFLLKST